MQRHHKVFGGLILGVILFLAYLTAGTNIPLGEIVGQTLHRVAIYLTLVIATLTGSGSVGYDVLVEAKKHPLGMPMIVSAIVLGAGLVVAQ